MKCSNNEISIGEYVRTPKEGIWIISHINKPFEDDDENKVCLCQNSKVAFISINTIKQLKHSKNIIDLIEEGDYVNGYKVLYVCNEEPCPSGKYVDIDCNKPSEESYFFESEIKSVITAEQIKQIEYRIKE